MSEAELARGIELFNNGEFFAAHEVLEDVWRASKPEDKKFFQGLTQVAVAFHHHSTGNLVGMQSVLRRAIGNLEKNAGASHPVDLQALLDALKSWCGAVEENRAPPDLPKIELKG
ncbi:MAG TPA: DUF309 domain-containing protein [Terriglobales bacterium]